MQLWKGWFFSSLLALAGCCTADSAAAAGSFRGVWVATVENLDFPVNKSSAQFKSSFSLLARKLAAKNCNAMIFQVRSNCDAFYPGKLAPYSRWMTGIEGRGFRNFDPMAFMIAECRRNGMEFHAWFNPYRVVRSTKLTKQQYLATLHPDNFARKNPDCVLAVELGKNTRSLMLDPGNPAVIRHLVEVVRDAALRYAPDAIHFDDYFYPYDGNVPDKGSFRKYNPAKLSLADWRRNNVNTLIRAVHIELEKINRSRKGGKIQFGISPFGIWRNRTKNFPYGSQTSGKESWSVQFADSRAWVKNNWIDYIVPQIYWHRAHKQAPFTPLLDWWCSTVRGTRVKLYIGHALYRFGTPGWGGNELRDQLRLVRSRREAAGSVLFSSRHLISPANAATRQGVSGIWK